MKNKIWGLIFVLTAAGFSACTFNVGTTPNSANSPNSTNMANNAAPSTTKAGEQTAKSGDEKTDSVKKAEQPGGEKPERIQFAAGKTDTSLTRTIPANGSLDFVFNAQSGQRLQFSVMYENGSDTDIEIFLTEPGMQDISQSSAANENTEFIIKKTGDHRITVNNTLDKPVTATLGVSIK